MIFIVNCCVHHSYSWKCSWEILDVTRCRYFCTYFSIFLCNVLYCSSSAACVVGFHKDPSTKKRSDIFWKSEFLVQVHVVGHCHMVMRDIRFYFIRWFATRAAERGSFNCLCLLSLSCDDFVQDQGDGKTSVCVHLYILTDGKYMKAGLFVRWNVTTLLDVQDLY